MEHRTPRSIPRLTADGSGQNFTIVCSYQYQHLCDKQTNRLAGLAWFGSRWRTLMVMLA